jgi:hypothetical protein
MTAHGNYEQPFPPVIRKACGKFLELRLGDVVSRYLRYLVNKLCESATTFTMYRLINIQQSSKNGWQMFKIGESLR